MSKKTETNQNGLENVFEAEIVSSETAIQVYQEHENPFAFSEFADFDTEEFAEFAEQETEEESGLASLPRVKMNKEGKYESKMWAVPQDQIDFNLLALRKKRIYYAPFGEDAGYFCKSADGKTGILNADGIEETYDKQEAESKLADLARKGCGSSCETCKAKEWGRSKGKTVKPVCTEILSLLCYSPATGLPFVIEFGRTRKSVIEQLLTVITGQRNVVKNNIKSKPISEATKKILQNAFNLNLAWQIKLSNEKSDNGKFEWIVPEIAGVDPLPLLPASLNEISFLKKIRDDNAELFGKRNEEVINDGEPAENNETQSDEEQDQNYL